MLLCRKQYVLFDFGYHADTGMFFFCQKVVVVTTRTYDRPKQPVLSDFNGCYSIRMGYE